MKSSEARAAKWAARMQGEALSPIMQRRLVSAQQAFGGWSSYQNAGKQGTVPVGETSTERREEHVADVSPAVAFIAVQSPFSPLYSVPPASECRFWGLPKRDCYPKCLVFWTLHLGQSGDSPQSGHVHRAT